jgi:ribonuclease HI
MSTFACQTCGRSFTISAKTLEKYPAWQPKQCLRCHSSSKPTAGRPSSGGRRGARVPIEDALSSSSGRTISPPERDLTLSEVLATYTAGPTTGVFTDGAAHPNPGAGGWGAVYVVDNEVISEARGAEPLTTNNRMELTALIAGYAMVPEGKSTVVMTDSQLCVDTINKWAAQWERNGWKRKGGPIKNLDLVQELYRLARSRPEIELRWIKSHNGFRWNEYADALATAYRREIP